MIELRDILSFSFDTGYTPNCLEILVFILVLIWCSLVFIWCLSKGMRLFTSVYKVAF